MWTPLHVRFARQPGAARLCTQLLRDYFAWDAADSVYQEVAHPSQQERANRTIDEYSVGLDLSRRRAEFRMGTGGTFSGTLPSALRMRTAPPPRPGPGNRCCWPA